MTTAPYAARLRGRVVRHSTLRQLGARLGHDVLDLWRSRIAFVFTLAFPLTWLVVVGFVTGNAVLDPGTGVRMMQFVTPAAAVMGLLYGAFPTVATSFASAREEGVLKRIRGTPLTPWVYLAGRVGAAVLLALASVLLMVGVGVVAYGVQVVGRTVLASLVTVAVGVACFAALGLAVATLARSAAVAQSGSIAAAVVLGFLSELFLVGQTQPQWMTRVASVFPLQHLVEGLTHQFDPYASGRGWDGLGLLVMGAWALAGIVVAALGFRWDPPGPRSRAAARPVARVVATRPVSVESGRPSLGRLLWAQTRWSNRCTWRDLGSVFFAVVVPAALFVLMLVLYGSSFDFGGRPFGVVMAAGMITWGGAVTAFLNLPEAVLKARDSGQLKRLRGTPLPAPVYLAGRLVSAVWLTLLTAALLLAVGLLLLDLRIAWSGLLPAAGLLVLGVLTLAAVGLALGTLVKDARSTTAAGLGILLPLAFFSNVFPIAGAPAWMGTVGAFLPLKHLADGLSSVLTPTPASFSWVGPAVMAAWLVAAGVVAVRRFRWSR